MLKRPLFDRFYRYCKDVDKVAVLMDNLILFFWEMKCLDQLSLISHDIFSDGEFVMLEKLRRGASHWTFVQIALQMLSECTCAKWVVVSSPHVST